MNRVKIFLYFRQHHDFSQDNLNPFFPIFERTKSFFEDLNFFEAIFQNGLTHIFVFVIEKGEFIERCLVKMNYETVKFG